MAGPPSYGARPTFHGPYGHRYRSRRRRAWRVARRLPVPLLIMAGVIGVSILVPMMLAAFGMAVLVGAIVGPVLIARGVRRSIRNGQYYRQRLAAGPYGLAGRGPALMPPQRPPQRPPVNAWRHAKSRFATLRSEYAAYECDALAVLRLPALADVTVPSTARFVEAFAEAQALDVDSPPEQPHRDRYIAAVELAWRSWHAAREAAERIRLSRLPEEERSTVERVVRLLTTARDSDNDAERLVAYAKARTELARLERAGHIRIPRPAQAALDNAYRGQLPA
ncbi:MAG TPA: hypothetical protein VGJ95_20000 [Pseudonocardiaceae bacterium]|jgi:hypothetical protein